MYPLIQQQSQLEALVERMQAVPVYALDTEFIKVNTFRPKLGVLQLNVQNQVYLLDGAALDFQPLWSRLFQAQQTIMHACGEDLDLIHFYAGQKPLTNVFDTQVALAFLGHGLQVSYQNALKLCLNIDIDKDQTRSDWLARPLTAEQLSYAANDVLHLPQMAEQIQQQLQQRGLYPWVLQDCQHLSAEIASETPSELLYSDVGNFRHSRKQLMQLQQLSVWREQLVHTFNIPRSFVIKNSSLIDLVEKNPKNNFELSKIRDMRPQSLREYGKTILTLLHDLPDEACWPARMHRPPRPLPEASTHIDTILDGVVLQTGIPKEVLMRKKWMNQLYAHVQDAAVDLPPYLLGWRYDLLTVPLLSYLKSAVQHS